jgi:hypothetical protein
MLNGTLIINIPVIIRPLLKRAVCGNDTCRAALLNQLLYNIAWARKDGQEYWYGTLAALHNQLDESWCLSKMRKELKALISAGIIGQGKMPGSNQTKQYFFGPEQGAVFKKFCDKAHICVHCMGFGPDVLALLVTAGVIDEENKCKFAPVENTKSNGKSNKPSGKSTSPSGKNTKSNRNKNSDKNSDKNPNKSREKGSSADQPGLFDPAAAGSSSPPSPLQEKIPTTSPEEDAPWTPTTMVQLAQALLGKPYRDPQKDLAAADAIFKKYGLDRPTFVRVFERIKPWWTEHRGPLHIYALIAKTQRGTIRIEELLEEVEYTDSRGASDEATPIRQNIAPRMQQRLSTDHPQPGDYQKTEIQYHQEITFWRDFITKHGLEEALKNYFDPSAYPGVDFGIEIGEEVSPHQSGELERVGA